MNLLMRLFKDIKYKIISWTALASFFMTIGSACALTVDPEIFRLVDKIATKNEQEVINELYKAKLDPMRGRMMLERSREFYAESHSGQDTGAVC